MLLANCNSFFFHAEVGIRDRTVTGVQTCALPIFPMAASSGSSQPPRPFLRLERVRAAAVDRKSVVEGKSVDLRGRRIIKKKKDITNYFLYCILYSIFGCLGCLVLFHLF